jgi:hypothetical protein
VVGKVREEQTVHTYSVQQYKQSDQDIGELFDWYKKQDFFNPQYYMRLIFLCLNKQIRGSLGRISYVVDCVDIMDITRRFKIPSSILRT